MNACERADFNVVIDELEAAQFRYECVRDASTELIRQRDDALANYDALRTRLEAAKEALHALVSVVLGAPEHELRGHYWDRVLRFANEARAAIAEMETSA